MILPPRFINIIINVHNISFIITFPENKFSSIGPIYYEYGSMVITYEDAKKAVTALYTLRESSYEDKQLLGKYFHYLNFFIYYCD